MKISQKIPVYFFYTKVQKSKKWPRTQIKGSYLSLNGEVRTKVIFTYVLGFVVFRDVLKVYPVSFSLFSRKTTRRNRARSHTGAWRGIKTKRVSNFLFQVRHISSDTGLSKSEQQLPSSSSTLSSSDSSGAWISSHFSIQVRTADLCMAPWKRQPRETRERLFHPEWVLKLDFYLCSPRFSAAGMVRMKNHEKSGWVHLIWNPGQFLTAGCGETPGRARTFISDQSKEVSQDRERRRKLHRCIQTAIDSARRDWSSARRDWRLFFQTFRPSLSSLGRFRRMNPRWKAWNPSKTTAPFLFPCRQGNER